MIKKITATLAYISLLVFSSPLLVVAREANPAPEAAQTTEAAIPERDGTYDEPTAKGIVKVRVIVHKEKPQTASAPLLVCGLADPDSSAVVPAAGWHLPSNWTYNINLSGIPSSVGSANMPTIVASSFGVWQSAVGGQVNLTRGSNTTVNRSYYDGKNIIAFNRISPSSLGITYIRYYPTSGDVVDVDTILNKRYSWSWSNSSTCADSGSFDAQNILTHEIGHWMGLDDTYDVAFTDNTMFGYGAKGEVKKNTLTTGDTAGVNAIYP